MDEIRETLDKKNLASSSGAPTKWLDLTCPRKIVWMKMIPHFFVWPRTKV
jgi:hypothetical protein